MAQVRLAGLSKRFGRTEAVKSVDLQVRDGELLMLVGPLGCGKTTLLRMIAGLEEPTSGEIFIGERRVNELPPKDRDVATVFQNYALSPLLTVYDNLAFSLRLSKLPLSEVDRRVRTAAAALHLDELLMRRPPQLSGAQRQQVAIGRAVVREPAVFLMDEPLANLDARLRAQARTQLVELHRSLGTTTIYVTHDQAEAMAMGDRIAVMRRGAIQQCDTPQQILDHPANRFVAGFIGSPPMNFVSAVLVEQDGALFVEAPPLRLRLPDELARADAVRPRVGREIGLGVRPSDIHDAALPGPIDPTEDNTLDAVVEVVEPTGAHSEVYMRAGDHSLIACLEVATWAADGEAVKLVVDMRRAHLFDIETDETIV